MDQQKNLKSLDMVPHAFDASGEDLDLTAIDLNDLKEFEIPNLDFFGITETGSAHTASEPPTGMFALSKNHFLKQFHIAKAKDKAARRGVKKFIRPENAKCILPFLPDPGDTTHAIVRGDFVLADIIPVILGKNIADKIAITTLGMSEKNAEMLAALHSKGQIQNLQIIVSHYFASVDATSTFAKVCKILGKNTPIVTRNHAKVVVIIQPPNFYTIAGSANLRSSDNIEQFAIWNDEEISKFHIAWMSELMEHTLKTSSPR